MRQHALEERELGGAMGRDEEKEDQIKAAGMRALFRGGAFECSVNSKDWTQGFFYLYT